MLAPERRNRSFDEPPPLKPGDEVRLEAEGIGTLTNRIVAQEHAPPELPAAIPGRRHHGNGGGSLSRFSAM